MSHSKAEVVLSAFKKFWSSKKKCPTNHEVSKLAKCDVETARLHLADAAKAGLIRKVRGAKSRKFTLK